MTDEITTSGTTETSSGYKVTTDEAVDKEKQFQGEKRGIPGVVELNTPGEVKAYDTAKKVGNYVYEKYKARKERKRQERIAKEPILQARREKAKSMVMGFLNPPAGGKKSKGPNVDVLLGGGFGGRNLDILGGGITGRGLKNHPMLKGFGGGMWGEKTYRRKRKTTKTKGRKTVKRKLRIVYRNSIWGGGLL